MTDTMKTLTEAVRIATGIPDAGPRPGQKTLTEHIEAAMATGEGHVVGSAPTGLGKSMALLAPAMVSAANDGNRTIISTESLSLLAQIFKKDAPVAAEACFRVTGVRPKTALLKGFSNYVCLAAARATAEAVTGAVGMRLSNGELRRKLKAKAKKGIIYLEGRPFDTNDGVPLLDWALDLGEDELGDRQSYEGACTPELWDAVSVGPSECVGDSCPLYEACKPRNARELAADADIVVTNHSMLAVQAAKGVPVLIGNKRLGEFDTIMVDEAHALPSNVRSAGASEVSPATIVSLVKSMNRQLDGEDKKVSQLIKEGQALAIELNDELKATAARIGGREEVFKLKDGDDPVENTGTMLIGWAKSVRALLEPLAKSPNMKTQLASNRLIGRLDGFVAAVNSVKLHRIGTARWIAEKDHRDGQPPYMAAESSPVNVGGLLTANLWTAPVLVDEEDEMVQAVREAGEPVGDPDERRPLAVIAVSATLPQRFGYQAGLNAPNVDYPSPFDDAYGRSMLFVPRVREEEIQDLYPGWSGGKARFNTKLHYAWASRKNVELVDANLGSGLILSATSQGGKLYADDLRRAAKGRWKVYSQWDGTPTEQLVKSWRADVSGVLVGTKSLMTGTDAPGETCTLVTVDRMPRAAGNPVDDARVEILMDAMDLDYWSAANYVYVVDAALLLEQAAGRLIRSMGDSGMFAVLDPRFLKKGPATYQETARQIYKVAVRRFSNMTAEMDQALEFLREASSSKEMRLAA